MNDTLQLGSLTLTSRLLLGTGKYATLDLMDEALAASGTEVVTVAVRRVKLGEQDGPDILSRLKGRYELLPNTAGCTTKEEALRTARDEADHPAADYLLGAPHLSDHLENGLDALGLSAVDDEDDLIRGG